MSSHSALYTGQVHHRRFRPRAHRLTYRVFWMLVDLDEISALHNRLRLFSANRFNLVSFHERDHGAEPGKPLRPQIERHLASAGIDLDGGPIRLLCMPRILGYVFNPISVYFCHRRGGELAAMLYEVNNTFGERHSYLIPVAERAGRIIRQSCAKGFYVSPFMDMRMTYRFAVTEPRDSISVSVRNLDAQGPILSAWLSGQRRELSDSTLLRTLATHPLLTFKVVAGIHWEAVKLWLKGIGLRARPAAPASPVTVVRVDGA